MRNLFLINFCLFLSVLHAAPLRVGVSVLPLESIAREIGGDAVEVRSLQQEGDSCSVFEPRPSAISWLAEAEVFFRTGVGYESEIMENIANQFPGLRVADLRESVTVLQYTDPHMHHHDHEGCHACSGHGSGANDPHIWLDPVRLAAIADFIADELIRARPEEAGSFRNRAANFKERCLKLHASLKALLEPYWGQAFYIYHPALAYFADRYGLRQIAIAGASQAPTARELHRLIAQAREEKVGTIFVQPQESHKHAWIVADAVGAELVEIDPMDKDWELNLMRMGEALAGALHKD